MKTLVVYYSYSGKTALAAQELAHVLSSDIVRIEDETKPSALKMWVMGSYAALKGKQWGIKLIGMDVAQYDRIFIGTPVWAWNAVPQVNAFIAQANFTGKKVVVFATMGGNNPGSALKKLSARITAQGGIILDSFHIRTGLTKNEEIISKAREIAQKFK